MDPLIGSTLLSVGGSLLGGLFGNRSAKKAAAQQRAWALEDQAMQWVRHREASERGGFNPLATLGMGQGVAPTPVSSNNYMGEAIAQSALILGENLAKTQAANKGRQVEDLRRQRDILTRKLTNQTIRPTVPGVYQRAEAFGTGGGNANASSSSGGVGPYSGPAHSGRIDSVEPQVKSGYETYTSHGAATTVPIGPDLEQVLPGWWINEQNKIKARNAFENSDAARAGRAQRFAPAPKPNEKPKTVINMRAALPPVMWGFFQ